MMENETAAVLSVGGICFFGVTATILLVILAPAISLAVYSLFELIYEGKPWWNTIIYHVYKERIGKRSDYDENS